MEQKDDDRLRVFALPLIAITTLAVIAFVAPITGEHANARWALLGAGAVLLAWSAALYRRARATGGRRIKIVIRRPHWIQPLAHLSIYIYWGTYWPEVGRMAPLIGAQIAFAYAFDMLMVWSRRDTYELGFGPFPIIFSTNLFLWFKPDWFALQLAMVALGFAAKELIRWDKGGRTGHVFNPSSFPLAVASVLLLATSSTDITWGPEIASTMSLPRYIYEWLFLVSLPGQILFGVAIMTLSAVATVHLLSVAYFAWVGTYFFVGPVPIAVFLGTLLLFTDPATSPRTDLGRIIYGVLYGASVLVCYEIFDQLELPTFYDKLLPVPFLNLSIRAIDRFASRPKVARVEPGRWLVRLGERGKNLTYVVIWAAAFLGIRAAHGLGDTHPSNRLPFWVQACDAGKRNACRILVGKEALSCALGSGWACNELGIVVSDRRPDLARSFPPDGVFRRACEIGFEAGCLNRSIVPGTTAWVHRPPSLGDYDVLLEAKAMPDDPTPRDLLETACRHGWSDGCVSLGYFYLTGELAPRDPPRALAAFAEACTRRNPHGCAGASDLLRRGDGVAADQARANALLGRACELGLKTACP